MRRRPSPRAALGLALILLVAGGASTAALVRTSTTFDEIVLVAAGARGIETGDRGMIVDQPPLMPLLYGAAARASGPRYPVEVRPLDYNDRWNYARAFYFDAGNDPERLALFSRLVGVACLLGLVAAVFCFTRAAVGAADRSAGDAAKDAGVWRTADVAALLAAALVAFLPDALAHAGVAYNDLPLALFYFLGAWALDAFVRGPSVARGVVAGLAVAAALAVKFSALALGPVGVALIACEAWSRRGGDRGWWGELAAGSVAGLLVWWAATAGLYGVDPALVGLRLGYYMTVLHASQGHPAPAFLLGMTSPTGWWWFFPVAFLMKTPVAFQLLTVVGLGALVRGTGVRADATSSSAAAADTALGLVASPLRAHLFALVVLTGFLLASSLNAGFRYALPALPPLCVLAAVGLARSWTKGGGSVRIGLAALVALHAGSTLSFHPWYLSYVSEWTGPRSGAREVVLDSSLDWGQGLLALRAWMAEEEVASVRLAYFGSALPNGYGIRYRALQSFLAMPEDPAETPGRGLPPTLGPGGLPEAAAPPSPEPEWTAISATNLQGLYFGGTDPYASYRAREPDAMVGGGSILLFRERR